MISNIIILLCNAYSYIVWCQSKTFQNGKLLRKKPQELNILPLSMQLLTYCFIQKYLSVCWSTKFFGLGSKSISLSTGFFVHRPKQCNMSFWGLDLISEFFVFFWLNVWVDEISKCGWCLPGGRQDWLKSLHKITTASWWFHHSLHLHID